MQEVKFKVGDKVIVTPTERGRTEYCSDLLEGKIYTVINKPSRTIFAQADSKDIGFFISDRDIWITCDKGRNFRQEDLTLASKLHLALK